MSENVPNVEETAKKPLEKARLRFKRWMRGLGKPERMPVEAREHRVAELVAVEGLSQREIAHQVGVSPQTVARDLVKPQVQQTVKEWREAIKRTILEESARDIIGPAMQMAREKIATGQAKDFDATMRGINALEKTTMSASGEAQKVDVTQVQVTLNRSELYARIEGLLERES